jgi:tetratricopeptide (TPR) repeat protein
MTEVIPGKASTPAATGPAGNPLSSAPAPDPAPALGMTDQAALQRAQRKANNLLWGIFILLLVLVGGVIFILPNYVSPPTPDVTKIAVTTAAPAGPAETPFEEAQRLRARQEAQTALEPLLALQDELERQGVARWAETPFNEAIALARQGDEAYAAQDYAKARDLYQNSLARLQDINTSEDTLYTTAMQQGTSAYEAGDTQAAVAAYDQALALKPDSAEAATGKERAQALAQVRDLLAAGRNLEAGNQLEAAREQYQKAQALDPSHPEVAAALASIQNSMVERNFAAAMSRGYAALQDGRATAAQEAFQEARGIKPNAPEVRSAMQQAKDQETFTEVSQHVAAAQRSESDEAWADALAAWDKALAVDPNLVSAQQGHERSQSRNNLDEFLRGIIAEPLRLADTNVHAQASQVLVDAERVTDAGPTLQSQLQQVRAFLQQVLVPATVQLQSDGMTEVTLLRVGELGTFTSHTLNLTPGTYTAVGIRPGYRDVRQEFVVTIDGQAPVVTVACNETI